MIAGQVACVSTAPRWAAQVVVSPLPTSWSQKGMLTSALNWPWRITSDFPAQMTKPSQTSSRTAVMYGGEPKCMAMGRGMTCLNWRLPRMSVCGMGDSNMATFSCCASFCMTGMAAAAFCIVALASRSSLKEPGMPVATASTWAKMSHQGRCLILKLVYPRATASRASASQSAGDASMDHQEMGDQSRTLFPSSL